MRPRLLLPQNFRAAGLLLFLLCFLLVCCKKNKPSANSGGNSGSDTLTTVTYFTNSSDPRLAQIQTPAGQRYTFYCRRNSAGTPTMLTAYSLENLPDSTDQDFVTFDDSGRYSSLHLHTGLEMQVLYNSPDSFQMVVSQPDSASVVYTVPLSGGNGVRTGLLKHLRGTAVRGSVTGAQRPKEVTGGFVANPPGSDGNVDVSVTNVNTVDGESTIDSTATVIVNISDGGGVNYSLPATYNSAIGGFSVPLSNFSTDYTNPPNNDISPFEQQAIQIIINGLNLICLSSPNETAGPIPNTQAAAVLASFITYVRALGPEFYLPATALLIVCNANTIINTFNAILNATGDLIQKIDPTAEPYSKQAQVSVTAYGAHGTVQSDQSMTVQQILLNNVGFDFLLTIDYSDSNSAPPMDYSPLSGTYNLIRLRLQPTPGIVQMGLIVDSQYTPVGDPEYWSVQINFIASTYNYQMISYDSSNNIISTTNGSYSIGPYQPDSLFIPVSPYAGYTEDHPNYGWGYLFPPGYNFNISFDYLGNGRLSKDRTYFTVVQNGHMEFEK